MMRAAKIGRRQRGDRRSFGPLLLGAILATSTLTAAPARAQDEDADSRPDARLMGYGENADVALGTSTTGSYLAAIVLGAVALGVLFKSSGRTHLD